MTTAAILARPAGLATRRLSLLKPTGHLTLGNLLGALRPMAAAQHEVVRRVRRATTGSDGSCARSEHGTAPGRSTSRLHP